MGQAIVRMPQAITKSVVRGQVRAVMRQAKKRKTAEIEFD
jgi:hypothetical protein